MKIITILPLIVFVIFVIIYLNYPFVWYKTEELAFEKFVDQYGQPYEKEKNITNGKLKIIYRFKKDATACSVSVRKQLLGYKVDYIFTRIGDASTYTSGLYKSCTISTKD